MEDNIQTLQEKANNGDEKAMVNLAAKFIKDYNLGKALELCNRLEKTNKPSVVYIVVMLRTACAIACEEKEDFNSGCLHWQYVEDTSTILLEKYREGKITSFDDEQLKTLKENLDKAAYSFARDWYYGVMSSSTADDTQRESAAKKAISKIGELTSKEAYMLSGVCLNLIGLPKVSYKMLKFLETDHSYIASPKDSIDERLMGEALVCLALQIEYGVADGEKSPVRACKFLKSNFPYLRYKKNQDAMNDFIKVKYGEKEMASSSLQEHQQDTPTIENRPSGSIPSYSHERMKQAVDLCMRRLALKQIIFEAKQNLKEVYISDEEYIEKNMIGYLRSDLILASMVTAGLGGLIACGILQAIFHWSDIMTGLILVIYIAVIISHDIKKSDTRRANIIGSKEFHDYSKRREWRDSHRDDLKKVVDSTTEELLKLEESMENRAICIIPKAYWDVGGMLWNYIENSRADNLKEAINLHEQLTQETEIRNIVNNIYSVAKDTQSAAERACFEAEMARMSSESADSHARNAEFWAMMNYYSR